MILNVWPQNMIYKHKLEHESETWFFFILTKSFSLKHDHKQLI